MKVKTNKDMFHVVNGKDTKHMADSCGFNDRKEGKYVVSWQKRRKRGICKEEFVVVSITEKKNWT